MIKSFSKDLQKMWGLDDLTDTPLESGRRDAIFQKIYIKCRVGNPCKRLWERMGQGCYFSKNLQERWWLDNLADTTLMPFREVVQGYYFSKNLQER